MGPSQCHPLFILYLPTPHRTSSGEHPGRVLTHMLQVTLDSKQALLWLRGLGKAFPSPSLTFLTSNPGR